MEHKAGLKAAFQRQAIEGKIRKLAARVYDLAPHPDAPHLRGPLFISLKSQFMPAADYDGLAGSIMMDALLGSALLSGANDNGASGLTAAPISANAYLPDTQILSDYLSEYLQHEDEKRKTRERGQGTFALGEHKSLCNLFKGADETPAHAAYHADLPERMALERAIETLSRRAAALAQAEAKAAAPALLCA